MTYANQILHPGLRLREWIDATRSSAAERRTRHDAYVRTLNALQSMSDRDLADIGISRLSIRDVARDAANFSS